MYYVLLCGVWILDIHGQKTLEFTHKNAELRKTHTLFPICKVKHVSFLFLSILKHPTTLTYLPYKYSICVHNQQVFM